MCELVGVSAASPVDVAPVVRALLDGAAENPDGFGVACYDGPDAVLLRDPAPIDESPLARTLADRPGLVRGPLVVGHVRASSGSGARLANTHPFEREFDGRSLVFAHNGTLRGFEAALPLSGRFRPKGDTDSEWAFCSLLDGIVRARGLDARGLKAAADAVARLGRFNFLLADGRDLYAYRGAGGNTLHVAEGRAAAGFGAGAAAIATRRPGPAGWSPLGDGELVVARDGRIASRLP